MAPCDRRSSRAFILVFLLFAGTGLTASAGETSVEQPEISTHPLDWTLRFANSRSKYIREKIHDYSCRLIKRERINGELQDHQFMLVRVRCERRRDGKVVEPTAVFIRYLAPTKLKDRCVLYIDGQNDGRMLVRKGGSAMTFLKLKLDPNGSAARRESNYPITDVGFDKIIERLVELARNDIERDPQAENTLVSHFRNAKVDGRDCTHIRVEHPKQADKFDFYRASLFVDDELQVPIRLVVYDWPQAGDEEPALIEEYTYVDLKLNVGLTDADFDADLLGVARD